MPFHYEFMFYESNIHDALTLQEGWFKKKQEGGAGACWDYILCAEHSPVYTFVPNKKNNCKLFKNEIDRDLNVPIVEVHRGGSITFHGPGQLVVYFVLNLKQLGISAFELNEIMDKSISKLLARKYGIFTAPKPENLPDTANGRWVLSEDGIQRKIALRGITVNNLGITRFGCAINITTDLSYFKSIFPCGLDIEMTSVERETGKSPDLQDTAYIFTDLLSKNFEVLLEKRHSA